MSKILSPDKAYCTHRARFICSLKIVEIEIESLAECYKIYQSDTIYIYA